MRVLPFETVQPGSDFRFRFLLRPPSLFGLQLYRALAALPAAMSPPPDEEPRQAPSSGYGEARGAGEAGHQPASGIKHKLRMRPSKHLAHTPCLQQAFAAAVRIGTRSSTAITDRPANTAVEPPISAATIANTAISGNASWRTPSGKCRSRSRLSESQ